MDPTSSVPSVAALPAAPRTSPWRGGREALQGYLFLAPAIGLLIVFLLAPAAWVFVLSLFKWDLISPNAEFAGTFNYQKLWADKLWWQSLWQTCYFVGVTVPVGMGIGLFLAVLLNSKLRMRATYRAIFFAPHFTPIVATLIIWQFIFNAQYGLINAGLKMVHLPTVGWLIDSRAIMPAIIIYSLWRHVGYNTVIFLAGLANVPAELEEAARVDGAGALRVFANVTWPLLTPTTYLVLLISMINAFKVFVEPYMLTGGNAGLGGGPGKAGLTIGFYLYQQAFNYFRAGRAAAISVALFVIILAVTALQMRLAGRRVFYR
jgi:ABC-type sugar transport system permease subunit